MWPWLIKAGKTIGSAVIGGIGAGLSRRAETQIAGSKAAQDYAGSGGASGISAAQTYTYGTQQASSQGQSEAFQAGQSASHQSRAERFSSDESAKQRAHEMMMLQTELGARNGQSDAGQDTPGQFSRFVVQPTLEGGNNIMENLRNLPSGRPNIGYSPSDRRQ